MLANHFCHCRSETFDVGDALHRKESTLSKAVETIAKKQQRPSGFNQHQDYVITNPVKRKKVKSVLVTPPIATSLAYKEEQYEDKKETSEGHEEANFTGVLPYPVSATSSSTTAMEGSDDDCPSSLKTPERSKIEERLQQYRTRQVEMEEQHLKTQPQIQQQQQQLTVQLQKRFQLH